MTIFGLIWIMSIILTTFIASRKGEGVLGFIAGCLYGPLGILMALFSSGHKKPQLDKKLQAQSESVVCEKIELCPILTRCPIVKENEPPANCPNKIKNMKNSDSNIINRPIRDAETGEIRDIRNIND